MSGHSIRISASIYLLLIYMFMFLELALDCFIQRTFKNPILLKYLFLRLKPQWKYIAFC